MSEFQKANNYSQAVKELKALDPDLEKTVPEEIKAKEKKMYHVLMIKINDRPGEGKNETVANLQLFYPRAFKKLTKNFHILGLKSLIVLHDPLKGQENEINVVIDEKTLTEDIEKNQSGTNPASEGKTPEQIEAEIDEKVKAKVEEAMKEFVESQNKGGTNPASEGKNENQEPEDKGKNSNKLNADGLNKIFEGNFLEMKDFAIKQGIDTTGIKKREEIINAITDWNNAQE